MVMTDWESALCQMDRGGGEERAGGGEEGVGGGGKG